LPDFIIFALGALSGIFAVLTIWAYVEKRREDEPWTERRFSFDKEKIRRWFLDSVWRKTRQIPLRMTTFFDAILLERINKPLCPSTQARRVSPEN
jgi:hypothetical protein